MKRSGMEFSCESNCRRETYRRLRRILVFKSIPLSRASVQWLVASGQSIQLGRQSLKRGGSQSCKHIRFFPFGKTLVLSGTKDTEHVLAKSMSMGGWLKGLFSKNSMLGVLRRIVPCVRSPDGSPDAKRRNDWLDLLRCVGTNDRSRIRELQNRTRSGVDQVTACKIF